MRLCSEGQEGPGAKSGALTWPQEEGVLVVIWTIGYSVPRVVMECLMTPGLGHWPWKSPSPSLPSLLLPQDILPNS